MVGTELGLELARRGHEVHFISYAPPIRLTPHPNIHYHEVEVSIYPLFEYPPYDLALATRMAEVAQIYEFGFAACALRDSSLGERDAGATDAGGGSEKAEAAVCDHAAWN